MYMRNTFKNPSTNLKERLLSQDHHSEKTRKEENVKIFEKKDSIKTKAITFT